MSEEAWDGKPQKSPCRSCGSIGYYGMRTSVIDGEFYEECTDCTNLGTLAASPDVYFKKAGETYKNLCDERGVPIPIESKRHKKEVMDRLGVQEAGTTVNGARFGSQTWVEGTRAYRRKQFEKDRPRLREIYKAWREKTRG